MLEFANKTKHIITVEENVLQGGFGSAILEEIQDHDKDINIINLGIPDTFVEHGPQNVLRAKYQIDAQGIYNTVKKMLENDAPRLQGGASR